MTVAGKEATLVFSAAFIIFLSDGAAAMSFAGRGRTYRKQGVYIR